MNLFPLQLPPTCFDLTDNHHGDINDDYDYDYDCGGNGGGGILKSGPNQKFYDKHYRNNTLQVVQPE